MGDRALKVFLLVVEMSALTPLLIYASQIFIGTGTIFPSLEMLCAIANSFLLATFVAISSYAFSFYAIVVKQERFYILFFSALILFIPGELYAHGFDRFARILSAYGFVGMSAEAIVLLAALFAYSIPFVSIAILLLLRSLGKNEVCAIVELMPKSFNVFLKLVSAHWRAVAMGLIFVLVILVTEATRTRILAEDLFGLGDLFLEPLVIDTHDSRNVPPALVAANILLVVPTFLLLYFAVQRNALRFE